MGYMGDMGDMAAVLQVLCVVVDLAGLLVLECGSIRVILRRYLSIRVILHRITIIGEGSHVSSHNQGQEDRRGPPPHKALARPQRSRDDEGGVVVEGSDV
eukprot:9110544-Pyramimonas_sp.AAC.1